MIDGPLAMVSGMRKHVASDAFVCTATMPADSFLKVPVLACATPCHSCQCVTLVGKTRGKRARSPFASYATSSRIDRFWSIFDRFLMVF